MTIALGYRKLRRFIVAWITLSTMLNLLCRQGLYILAPVFQRADQLHLSESSYSKIVSMFSLAYALMRDPDQLSPTPATAAPTRRGFRPAGMRRE